MMTTQIKTKLIFFVNYHVWTNKKNEINIKNQKTNFLRLHWKIAPKKRRVILKAAILKNVPEYPQAMKKIENPKWAPPSSMRR